MSHEPTWPQDATMPAGIPHPLTRREWLVSAAALAAVAGSPPLTARSALAQTPKRGGTLTLRLGPAALGSPPDHLLQDPHRLLVHP
jgi:hypothetical protein